MAPVGSRHASRHQATVMEEEEEEEEGQERRSEGGGENDKAQTSGGDLCFTEELG